MPLPKPQKKQEKKEFISSCMADPKMNEEFKDAKQRYAVCNARWDDEKSKASVLVESDGMEVVFTEEQEDLAQAAAENKKLNKPFRLPSGSKKKFGVYVKNPKTGNIVMVKFGDPNMEIKRDDPQRRKNFRSRHKCDTAKDKTTPRYWSCKMWSKKSVSDITASNTIVSDEFDTDHLPSWDEFHSDAPELLSVQEFIIDKEL